MPRRENAQSRYLGTLCAFAQSTDDRYRRIFVMLGKARRVQHQHGFVSPSKLKSGAIASGPSPALRPMERGNERVGKKPLRPFLIRGQYGCNGAIDNMLSV